MQDRQDGQEKTGWGRARRGEMWHNGTGETGRDETVRNGKGREMVVRGEAGQDRAGQGNPVIRPAHHTPRTTHNAQV